MLFAVVVGVSSPGRTPSANAASAPTASTSSSTSSHGQRERLRGVGRAGSFSPLSSESPPRRGAMRVASTAGTSSVGSRGITAISGGRRGRHEAAPHAVEVGGELVRAAVALRRAP